jgi:NADPH-dependent 2,4-dienoyl-CoA reductase/sulfur reductase-like enzyme
MCLECLVGFDSQSDPDCLVRVDSHSGEAQGRVLSAITKDEAMEFAPVGTYPSTGIDVLIVGTGFGGLTAALEFTRKGHNVRVLERNNEPDISGKIIIP